jgi:hypothetical protein
MMLANRASMGSLRLPREMSCRVATTIAIQRQLVSDNAVAGCCSLRGWQG